MKLIDRLIGVMALLAIGLFPAASLAHHPQRHEANTLADARNKVGGMCCNGQDYEIPLDWKRTDFGFKVKLSGGPFRTRLATALFHLELPIFPPEVVDPACKPTDERREALIVVADLSVSFQDFDDAVGLRLLFR
jgi:hypothetical protein